MKISKIKSIEVLDSRARPTLCTTVYLDDGSTGQAMVPSGASTGQLEAYELRDKNYQRYCGLGVQNAVKNSEEALKILKGVSSEDQLIIDNKLIELDATENKSKLGANAILSVSLACARAASNSMSISLYEYLNIMYKGISNKNSTMSLPVPMLNIMNGGCHANNNVDIQEFMIMPVAANSIREAVRMGSEIFHTLKKELTKAGLSTGIGDEGGFAPNLSSTRDALDFILQAIDKAGYKAGEDVYLALDCAATEYYRDGKYHMKGEGVTLSSEENVAYLTALVNDYPIISIEDGMAEDDWAGWNALTEALGARIQLVGDDLFVTNPNRLADGIRQKSANSMLVKVNQIGSLSETLKAVDMAHRAGFTNVMSHRSGETEDTTIADLAVATNCGQIKTGSLARSDRLAKYNQLIRIEEELGDVAEYAGQSILRG